MKDLFSKQSEHYAKFRPTYPKELISFIESIVEKREACWDCGTGNGQLAVLLSNIFDKVYATDISEKQLLKAEKRPNIQYSKQPAEQTTFADNQFDLITVAQAIHWFDFNVFYQEVQRTLKPEGTIVVLGYGLLRINEQMDSIIDDFYLNITGPYWDSERSYLDENYETIPFPFEEIKVPTYELVTGMTLDQLVGFFNSWSAVQHYKKQKGANPVELIKERLQHTWVGSRMEVSYPFFVRAGKLI